MATQTPSSQSATALRSAAVIEATEDPAGLALGHKMPKVLGDLVARLGRAIVVVGDGERYEENAIVVWDLATQTRLHSLCKQRDHFTVRKCFLVDNATRLFGNLIGMMENPHQVWSLRDGTVSEEEKGDLLAVTPDGSAKVWSTLHDNYEVAMVSTATPGIRELHGHSKRIWGGSLSKDGRLLVTASEDKTARVWRTDDGTCLRTLIGHESEVNGCAISGDVVVTCGDDNTVRVWSAEKGTCIRVLEGHTAEVWDCAISKDGQTAVSTSADNTVRVWRIADGACLHTLEGHSDGVGACAILGDGSMAASASSDSTIRVWDLASGACLQVLRTSGARCVAISVADL